ncbi:MAG: hypothetical protein HKN82_02095 [Akkermansiaceae bacterium]|nr:hypothetical protein [Akkermansiaceae bacterium]
MSDHPHLESALPGFSEARGIIKAAGDSVFPLQYRGTKFDFYRFANRFRMAVRFRGISLADFGDETEAGYSALTRVFLVWSVFERYSELAGDPPPYRQLLSLVPRIELARVADHIERHDPEKRLYDFLYDQSLEQNRGFLDRYRNGDRCGIVFYAAAIRHIYVHGHLTAHPNKCEATDVVSICDELAEFVLGLMRDDFARRVAVARGAQ